MGINGLVCPWILQAPTRFAAELLAADDIHPSQLGHEKIAEAIAAVRFAPLE